MIITLKTGEKHVTNGVGTMLGDTGYLLVYKDVDGKAHFLPIEELWFIEGIIESNEYRR